MLDEAYFKNPECVEQFLYAKFLGKSMVIIEENNIMKQCKSYFKGCDILLKMPMTEDSPTPEYLLKKIKEEIKKRKNKGSNQEKDMRLIFELKINSDLKCNWCNRKIEDGDYINLDSECKFEIKDGLITIHHHHTSLYHNECVIEGYPEDIEDNIKIISQGYILCLRDIPCEKCSYFIKKCEWDLKKTD